MPSDRSLCISRLFLLTLLFFPAAVWGQSASTPEQEKTAPKPSYDGEWWLSLGGWEQYGFLSGYENCYLSEYHGSVGFPKEVQSYVDDLNKYYLADASRLKTSVSDALDALRDAGNDAALPLMKRKPREGSQEFDGKFWFEADSATQLGFVEGYLACHSAKLKDADAQFSKAPSDYVELINKAYNITDNTDDVDEDKAPLKIADVLHRLKDEAAPAAKPGGQGSPAGVSRSTGVPAKIDAPVLRAYIS